MRNFLSTSVLLVLATLAASPVWSQVESVKMRVDGLACPFCAYGLEKRIKDVPGVSNIEIRVQDGVLLLDADPDEAIALDHLEPAVEKAGFTAREITATAVGSVATVDDRHVLDVSGTDTELILEENQTVNALLAELEGSKRVRVTGRLEEKTPEGHHAHPFTMRVDSFEILSSETE